MAHILVIDDEADIRTILEALLTREGHTVDSTDNGEAGLRLADQNRYDLVISDVLMPGMDGLEVVTRIRQKFPDMRIIVMTGGTAKIDKGMLLSMTQALKAFKVVTKPISFKELKDAVNEILAG